MNSLIPRLCRWKQDINVWAPGDQNQSQGDTSQDTNGWLGPRKPGNGNQRPINGRVPGSQLLGSGKQMTNAGQDINGLDGWAHEIKGSAWLGPRKSWLGSGDPEHNVWAPGKPDIRAGNQWLGPNQIHGHGPWLGNDHNEFAPIRPMIELKKWRSNCCFCGQVSYLITSAKDRNCGGQNESARQGSSCSRL